MNDFILGAFSGIGQTIVGHPFDTAKVRIQNNAPIKNMKFSHYYRGIPFPIISSSIVNAIVFGTYYNSLEITNNRFLSGSISGVFSTPFVYSFEVYKTKRQMNEKINMRSILHAKGLNTTFMRETIAFGIYFSSYDYMCDYGIHPFISGGISGMLNWTATYNLDVIRNRQIYNNCSFKQAFQMGNLWKGYGICMVRAFIVNSVGFLIYEEGKKYINN